MLVAFMAKGARKIHSLPGVPRSTDHESAFKGMENLCGVQTAGRVIAKIKQRATVQFRAESLRRVVDDRYGSRDRRDFRKGAGVAVNIDGNNRGDVLGKQRSDLFRINGQSFFVDVRENNLAANS